MAKNKGHPKKKKRQLSEEEKVEIVGKCLFKNIPIPRWLANSKCKHRFRKNPFDSNLPPTGWRCNHFDPNWR